MFHTPAHKNLSHPGACVVIDVPAQRDFSFVDHGSIVILKPLTSAARSWASDHLPDDCARWGSGYVIEHRYFADVLDGIDGDGLVIIAEGR